MKAIIAGGRDYHSCQKDFDALDAIHKDHYITEVATGAAPGADLVGETWANSHKIPVKRFPADWAKYGLSAGPKRNLQMLDYMNPASDIVILFPGGKGTAHMRKNAQERGFQVFDVGTPQPRILVGNLRDKKRPTMSVVYIGRPMPGQDGSPLGNPFKIQRESERQAAYDKYCRWLDEQMKEDTPARQEIYKIATWAKSFPVMLLCWCKPALCHGDYIKEIIDKIMAEKEWGTAMDPYGQKIHCEECNGFLWDVSVFDHVPDLIPCPYKGSGGQCEHQQ